jgi:drug/metabolite transporter (DMT)-like permease
MHADRVNLALLGVVALLWGSAFIAIRAGILAGVSPFVFAAYRYALAAGVTVAVAYGTRQPRPDPRTWVVSSLLGGIFLMGAYAALVYWGEQYTSGGFASVLVSTAPIWTAVAALSLLPSERLRGLGWIGIAAGFSGVVLLFLPGLAHAYSGGIAGPLALTAAAASAAFGSVMLRRLGLRPAGLWNLSGELGIATLLLLPLALVTPGGLTFPVSALTVGTLVYLAIGSSVFGYGLYFVLLQRAGPTRANVVAYLNPVVGLTVGIIALQEAVSLPELAGFVLILLAVALIQLEGRRTGHSPPASARRADDRRSNSSPPLAGISVPDRIAADPTDGVGPTPPGSSPK